MGPGTTAPAGHERLHALDALRAFAMFLGIVIHVGTAYMVTAAVDWPRATAKNLVFDVGMAAIHGFRLQVFFVVAGFFARLLLHRVGTREFIRHRAARIALPFLLGMLTVIPLTGAAWNYSFTHSWASAIQSALSYHILATTGHLWFLYYLLVYYAATLILAPAGRRVLAGTFAARVDRCFARTIRSPFFFPVLIVPTVISLSFAPLAMDIGSAFYWVPVPRIVFYYAAFYGFGWLLHRNIGMLQELKRVWAGYAAVSLGSFALSAVLGLYQANPRHPHHAGLKLATICFFSIYAWSSVFALLNLFLRYLNHRSNLVRYYADASYWFYLVHLPVVLFLQAFLNRSNVDVFAQFFIVLTATLLFCAVTYHYGVRFTWIGTMLNGRRERTS